MRRDAGTIAERETPKVGRSLKERNEHEEYFLRGHRLWSGSLQKKINEKNSEKGEGTCQLTIMAKQTSEEVETKKIPKRDVRERPSKSQKGQFAECLGRKRKKGVKETYLATRVCRSPMKSRKKKKAQARMRGEP